MFHVALKLRLVDLNYNFECNWLIELSDNKLATELTIEKIAIFMITDGINKLERNGRECSSLEDAASSISMNYK